MNHLPAKIESKIRQSTEHSSWYKHGDSSVSYGIPDHYELSVPYVIIQSSEQQLVLSPSAARCLALFLMEAADKCKEVSAHD